MIRESWRLLVSMLRADEGSLWIYDRETGALRLVLNSGAEASTIEMSTETKSEEAQVMKCFTSGEPVEDTSVFERVPRDEQVDLKLHQQTFYQVSVPFFSQAERIGVVSIVQLGQDRPAREWGFPEETAARLQVISKLLERILCPPCSTVGVE